jgi:LysM repeat protein
MKNRLRTELHKLGLLFIIIIVLAACTRTRTPGQETVAAEVPKEPVSVAQGNDGEPEVSRSTTEEDQPEDSSTPEATPTPEEKETFQYIVEVGDTLASIAGKFETNLATLRELNFLSNDSIYVGQPIQVPHREGISQGGLPTPTPEPFYHTVQADDTLSSIAVQYDVNFNDILAANTIPNPDIVPVGTQLLIPGYQPSSSSNATEGSDSGTSDGATESEASTPGVQVEHIVQPNESLGQIAEAYDVDINELALVNNITNRNILRVGQRLIIPGLTELDVMRARGVLHIVQPGEGIISIAAEYGVDPEQIIELNGIENPDIIPVGQELLIPPAE